MDGPFFRYLTDSYVKWLGLESFPVDRGNFAIGWVSDHGVMPVSYRGFDICVAYNHGLYVREPDGLAWSLSK